MSSVSLVFSLDILFTPGELIQMDGHVAHARALATKEEADAHLMATQAPMLMAAPASREEKEASRLATKKAGGLKAWTTLWDEGPVYSR